MTERPDTPDLPADGAPDGVDDLLADALLEDALLQANGSADGVSEALRQRALAAPEIATAEALLADALEGASEALLVERELAAAPAMRLSLRRAALAAFDRAEVPAASVAGLAPHPADADPTERRSDAEAVRTEPLRARRLAPLLRLRGAAVAAAAVFAIGLGLLVMGDEDEAYAGLQLRALARADTSSSVQTSRIQPLYFATLGETFTPDRDELLRFSLDDETMVVVGGGDAIRVSRAALAADGVRADDAVLRLESGEAQLATRGRSLPLLIDGVGLLVLAEGAAHVAVDAGDGQHRPAVALHEGSRARFHRADGSGSVPLVGPTRVLLGSQGVEAYGAPARALFHELRFFGGPLPEATHRRVVSARLFRAGRVADKPGRTRKGRQDIRLLAPAEAAAATHASARFAWRPEPAVASARALEVALRAPSGSRITLLQDGQAPLHAKVTHAGDGREPGVATVTLALPEGWFDRLPAGRLTLLLDAPLGTTSENPEGARERVVAWFDGIALVFGPGADGRNGD